MLRPAEGGLLWRTAKADVGQEIALPPQTHRVTYLTLNAIERHFYMEQHKVKGVSTHVSNVRVGSCSHIPSSTAYQAFRSVQHLNAARLCPTQGWVLLSS